LAKAAEQTKRHNGNQQVRRSTRDEAAGETVDIKRNDADESSKQTGDHISKKESDESELRDGTWRMFRGGDVA